MGEGVKAKNEKRWTRAHNTRAKCGAFTFSMNGMKANYSGAHARCPHYGECATKERHAPKRQKHTVGTVVAKQRVSNRKKQLSNGNTKR